MTLTIELTPQVEAWITSEALRRGVPPTDLAAGLLEDQARFEGSSYQPMSPEERSAALDRLAGTFNNMPQLPDSAFDRETIYEDRF